jgi:hypothetical protein
VRKIPGASSLEDRIERGCKARSAIADEEPDVPEPPTEGESKVAGLLHCPVPGRMRGDAAQVHPAGTVLGEHQHIQPVQQHSTDVKEINREDPGGLCVQELPPGRTCPARRGIDARSAQDLIDGRGRHGKDPGPAAARDESRQGGEPGPVGWLVPHPPDVPAQHRVFVPDHQQLSVLGTVTAQHQGDQAK